MLFFIFFFKQKTAYEMRISDWSSDVCSSDLALLDSPERALPVPQPLQLGLHAGADRIVGNVDRAEPRGDPFVQRIVVEAEQGDVTEIGRASCRERVCQYV